MNGLIAFDRCAHSVHIIPNHVDLMAKELGDDLESFLGREHVAIGLGKI